VFKIDWNDFKAKAFFIIVGFLVLGLLSIISGENDPIDLIWGTFWSVVWVVGSISIATFVFLSLRDIFRKR
jgi:hypothetical protein